MLFNWPVLVLFLICLLQLFYKVLFLERRHYHKILDFQSLFLFCQCCNKFENFFLFFLYFLNFLEKLIWKISMVDWFINSSSFRSFNLFFWLFNFMWAFCRSSLPDWFFLSHSISRWFIISASICVASFRVLFIFTRSLFAFYFSINC